MKNFFNEIMVNNFKEYSKSAILHDTHFFTSIDHIMRQGIKPQEINNIKKIRLAFTKNMKQGDFNVRSFWNEK